MVRWLNVAEKNDAAKGIAAHLSHGNSQRSDTHSRFNKLYSFRIQLPRVGDIDMAFTSVSGHLLTQELPANMKNWATVPEETCFTAPVLTVCPQDNQPLLRTLQEQARRSDALVIWTDCDREGEAIGFEIIDVCRQVNPRLTVYRARFSEITAQAVWRAINNLVAPDARLNDAVLARSELDLRTGAAFTRLQTLRLRTSVPQIAADGQNRVISYGSCQFPTLGFVVERYKARAEFVEEAFWKLRVSHRKADVTSEFAWARNRLFNRQAVEALQFVCQLAEIARVTSVRQKPKSRWRPVPLDTVELEKLGVRKLRLTAKQTLDTAEKLYQKGYISYPRTETNIFPPDLNLGNLVTNQAADPTYANFANDVLNRGVNPRRGQKSDQAHPPIHPLKQGSDLHDVEARVFDLVARHFLACVSRDATGSETIVEIDLGGEAFTGTGLVILDRGYLDIYPFDQWSAKVIGHYQMGETFRPDRIELLDGRTSAPPLLSEADLITLMDKHGIGTDATHAQHIETIQERTYVGLTPEARFIPGFLGLGLVEGYEALGYALAAPGLRAEFEADLKAICEGRKTRREVVDAYIVKYRDIFTAAQAQFAAVIAALRNQFGHAPQGQGGGAPGRGGGGRGGGVGRGGGGGRGGGPAGGPPGPPRGGGARGGARGGRGGRAARGGRARGAARRRLQPP